MQKVSEISVIHKNQKEHFLKGTTKSYAFRLEALKKLRKELIAREKELMEALWLDLHKSPFEVYAHELGQVLKEIDLHIRKLKRWMRPERKTTPLVLFPSKSRIVKEPYGTVLIMAPWNYPMLLLLDPLIGAIAAGNTVVLKPSEYSVNFNNYLQDMITSVFSEEYIAVVTGGRSVNQELLSLRWNYIFFTGSPMLGKVVMKAAAQYLTPLTLELGGKSPCIVDADANLKLAAKRIVWGKFINGGQTCVAPDYLLVHSAVKDELIALMKMEIEKNFGSDACQSPDLCRIINQQAYERIVTYLDSGELVYGGDCNAEERYISPTILDEVSWDSPVMQDEIFGPIFPVLSFDEIDKALVQINQREKPLAFYYFSNNLKKARNVLSKTTSGGGCINDTIIHIANNRLPFGGVGNSGMGKYHGKLSFETFSNSRAMVFSSRWLDIPIKYPPYGKKLKLVKFLLKL